MSLGSNNGSVMNMVRRIRGTLRISVTPHSNPSTIVTVLHVLRCVREFQETLSGRYENLKALIYAYGGARWGSG